MDDRDAKPAMPFTWPSQDRARIEALLSHNMKRVDQTVYDITRLIVELDRRLPKTAEREDVLLELHEFLNGLDSIRRHQSRAYHIMLTMQKRTGRAVE